MLHITRYFSVVILALVIMLSAGETSAQAAELTEKQVQSVMSLMASFDADPDVVEAVKTALTTKPEPVISFCDTANTNLRIGATGVAVSALQRALRDDGVAVSVTGQFDTHTAFAVKAFQEKYAAQILSPLGLEYGTGYVGPSTRAQLSALKKCGQLAELAPTLSAATTTAEAASTTTPLVEKVKGSLDYNDDGVVTQADTQILLEVAVGSRECGIGKVCDLNKDGKTVASDALILANYIGTSAKTGQLDYNDDLRLDSEDTAILREALTTQCAEGRICDLSGDSKFNEADIELFTKYVGS